MKTKRMLAVLLALCVGLGCMSLTAFAEAAETITLDDIKTLTVLASDEFVDEYVYYSFTPDEDGTYAACVTSDAVEEMSYITVYTEDETLETFYYDTEMLFVAEAGQTCELVVNYWGEYPEDVEYTVSVVKCQPIEEIYFDADYYEGWVGEYAFICISAEPWLFELEPIEWVSSDPEIVSIENLYSGGTAAELYLAAPGAVMVTATTESGLTASMEIIVEEAPEAVELTVGENTVTVPYEGLEVSFTPEVTGYYTMTVSDEEMCYCYFYDADSVSDGMDEYYSLEADVTYHGWIISWEEDEIDLTVTLELCEDVQILEPVDAVLNKLPDNTTFLSSAIYDLWDDQVLGGLELTVTWSDGSESVWCYDEEYQIGSKTVYYELVEDEQSGEMQAVLYIYGTDIPGIAWDLTLLDLEVESIALVDDSPLQIVEYSCGIDIGALMDDDSLDGWYYLPLAAYDREVVITFSDGSTVTARPGDSVYGVEVYCEDSQYMEPWTKDGENLIVYYYGDAEAVLTVEIVDSPVERIELITPPNTTFILTEDFDLVNEDGEIVESFKQFLSGLSMTVYYKDGTAKTFAEEDIQWVNVMGEEYPFVDGYPLGLIDGMLFGFMDEDLEAPCEIEASLEYMGASATYTISLIEEFEGSEDVEKEPADDGEEEQIPQTGDVFVPVAAAVLAVLCGVVLIAEKKKLF